MSLQILHNLALALIGSLLYMITLVYYVKSTYNLTLDVHCNIVLSYWMGIIIVIYSLLEIFDKRNPIKTLKGVLK